MINARKIFNTYKGWEEYNTHNDIGLLTLYQQQNQKPTFKGKPQIITEESIQVSEPKLVQKQQKNQIQTNKSDMKASVSSKRYKTPEIKNNFAERYDQKRQHFSVIKKRAVNPNIMKECKVIISEIKDSVLDKRQRKMVKKGYYDVGKMGSILSCRSDNSISAVYTLSEQQNRYHTQTIQEREVNKNGSKNILAAKRADLQKKQKMNREAYIKSIRNLLDRSQIESLSQHANKHQSPSFIKFKLINLDAMKIKKKNNDFRTIFKKQLNSLSERYNASSIQVECCTTQMKDIKDSVVLSNSKKQAQMRCVINKNLCFQAKTIPNKPINDNGVKELVEMYFTKANKQARRMDKY